MPGTYHPNQKNPEKRVRLGWEGCAARGCGHSDPSKASSDHSPALLAKPAWESHQGKANPKAKVKGLSQQGTAPPFPSLTSVPSSPSPDHPCRLCPLTPEAPVPLAPVFGHSCPVQMGHQHVPGQEAATVWAEAHKSPGYVQTPTTPSQQGPVGPSGMAGRRPPAGTLPEGTVGTGAWSAHIPAQGGQSPLPTESCGQGAGTAPQQPMRLKTLHSAPPQPLEPWQSALPRQRPQPPEPEQTPQRPPEL